MRKLLSLDLSTTSTGYSIFNIDTKELLDYGAIKPKVKGLTKLDYPQKQLYICKNLIEQLAIVIETHLPECVVIEEVNRHMNRLAGKTLDISHGFVWELLENVNLLNKTYYLDSDGATGWRSKKCLNLIMSDADREHNKEAKKLNRTMGRGHKKIPIINKKHLAARFVNKIYGTKFDVDENKSDADVCDSIGLGHAFLNYVL